jgi:hypothetical protein
MKKLSPEMNCFQNGTNQAEQVLPSLAILNLFFVTGSPFNAKLIVRHVIEVF